MRHSWISRSLRRRPSMTHTSNRTGIALSFVEGFTLIELLIALAIVAMLIAILVLGQGLQLSRGEDARRKADLAKLKVSFEDYYNDKGCYPPAALLQRCGSADLSPYVAKIPCDPRTKAPYPY